MSELRIGESKKEASKKSSKKGRKEGKKEERKKEVETRSAIEQTIHENLEFAICSILKDVSIFQMPESPEDDECSSTKQPQRV